LIILDLNMNAATVDGFDVLFNISRQQTAWARPCFRCWS
jgi:hypothetical protein